MVLQKRLDYGFVGYQVPPTPRATRSARRRVPFKKKVADEEMSPFDLLATVAGKLLQEEDNVPTAAEMFTGKDKSTVQKDFVKKEQPVENSSDKGKLCDEGSCGRNFFVSEIVSQAPALKHSAKELSVSQNDACSALASVVTNSDCSEKFSSSVKLLNGEHRLERGNSSTNVNMGFCRKSLSFGSNLDDKSKKHVKIEPLTTGKGAIGTRADIFHSVDPVVWDVKPSALGDIDTSLKLPVKPSFPNESRQKNFKDQNPRGSFPACRDNVKLVSRDDDDNYFGCTQPSTLNKSSKQSPPRIGGRRIRRFLASKYWKGSPKSEDEERLSAETKSVYHNRVNSNKRQRSLRDYPLKKRRLYDRNLLTDAEDRVNSDYTSSSPGKGSSGDASGSVSTMHEAMGASAFTADKQTSFQQRDSNVKLKIKSFRVPELFIEIPETATVGSLKGTVMDAVTAILGGGLHVGVVHQGKKLRDDNKTLLQMGISGNDKFDALGFTLEPNSPQVPPPVCPEDHSYILPCDTSQSLSRYPHGPVVQHGVSDVSQDVHIANFGNIIESDHDSAPSPPDMSTEKSMSDSKALIPVPDVKPEALAVVPMRKSKRSDVGQRRIRRPFSVSEVEALVQAVEKLGTGRWRDVKLRAFDNAKHRTYVDLKDKWKTLVHTARISPQQRRGEPVPQELLDRVLAAHAFWSQQQAKQQLKQHSEARLLF